MAEKGMLVGKGRGGDSDVIPVWLLLHVFILRVNRTTSTFTVVVAYHAAGEDPHGSRFEMESAPAIPVVV